MEALKMGVLRVIVGVWVIASGFMPVAANGMFGRSGADLFWRGASESRISPLVVGAGTALGVVTRWMEGQPQPLRPMAMGGAVLGIAASVYRISFAEEGSLVTTSSQSSILSPLIPMTSPEGFPLEAQQSGFAEGGSFFTAEGPRRRSVLEANEGSSVFGEGEVSSISLKEDVFEGGFVVVKQPK